MKQYLTQIKKNIQEHIKLSEKEKTDAKQTLFQHMKKNPVLTQTRTRWFNHLVSINFITSPTPYVASVLALILIGSGISYTAKNALPGDMLYQVKISINEEIRSMLHTTSESQAVYEANRVTKRLEEIEQLTNRGTIAPKTLKQISANIESHLANIKAYTNEKPSDLPSQATSTTDTHKSHDNKNATSSRLIDTDTTSTTTSPTSTTTSNQIHSSTTTETSTSSTSTRENTHTKTKGTTTDDQMGATSTSILHAQKNTSKQNIDRLKKINKHIIDNNNNLKSKEQETISKKIQDAQLLYKKGIKSIRTNNISSALTSFTKAQREMNEIEAMIKKHFENTSAMIRFENVLDTGTTTTDLFSNNETVVITASSSHASTSTTTATSTKK